MGLKMLTPITIKNTTFKNRIMFPPLTTGYEDRGVIGETSFNFYKRLAEGGVGLIILGNVACAPGFGMKLMTEDDIPMFKRLADECHKNGAKLGVQLFYREFDAVLYQKLTDEGKEEEARNVIREGSKTFPQEATKEQLQDLIERGANAAVLAKKAGIDVIQIHGDRLTGVLLSTKLNHRTDEYGGSFENRTRFVLELVRAIRKAVPDMVIDFKLAMRCTTPEGTIRGNGGLELDEAIEFAKLLEKEGVDMIHAAQANHTSNIADTIPPMGIQPYGTVMYENQAIRNAVSIPTSCVARIITPEAIEAVLNNDEAEIVAMGRPLLCDPDIVKKCEEGRMDEIRLCVMCNKGCTDSIMSAKRISCVLNAENGHEAERHLNPIVSPKKVAVVGAGLAGLEAARVAAVRGHKVEVFEKTLRIGGQINMAAVPPRKEELFRSLRFFERVLPKLGVKFHMGTEATAEMLKEFDKVIVATGGKNVMLKVPGSDLPHVVSAWDVLDHKAIVFGNVVVIGGGLVGSETAEYLGSIGLKVTVVEMLDQIAKQESATIRPYMMENYEKYKICQMTNTRLLSIEQKKVLASTLVDGKEETVEIPADFVVMAVGTAQEKPVFEGLDVLYAGDCAGERATDIGNAIKTGYDAANSIE